MFLNLLNIIKDMLFFTGSYSNNVFLEPLSPEEEEKAINDMLNGSVDARNKLIEHNLRLVAHIVKKFDVKEENTDDLISIGTIGLIKGIDTYKNNKKTKITTYAARCIQNEILMYFRSNKKYGPTVSLNDAIGHDKEGNEINLIDVIKDNDTTLFEKLDLKNNIMLLKKYLKLLKKQERDIIIKRYGLNNKKGMTQKKIAKELKISRSYVSRIEKRALTKMLTEFIKNKNID
ncbi:rNA polymerase sigma factor [Clostridium sp. CAG:609]|nr:rNA polymerase sigma factor [Clostridium sp. CAG:609]